MARARDDLTYTEYCPGGAGELPSVYRFGSEGSIITQILDITKPTSPEEIARAILGWSIWKNGTGTIDRHIPLKTFAAQWLYAQQIDMHAVGKRTYQAGSADAAGYTRGEFWRTHVTYKSLPYQVEADPVATGRFAGGIAGVILEYHRYAEWQLTPGIEVIERQVSTDQFKYVNGPNAGSGFPRSLQKRAPKSHLLLRQHQMPHRALFKTNNVLRPQFFRALGAVNSNFWPTSVSSSDPAFGATPPASYAPGVCLLTQIGLNPVEAPVSPEELGLNPRCNTPRCWTVDWHFILFDPPTDPTAGYGGHGGHQLAPSMKADVNANYYYLVAAGVNPTVNSPLIYPEVDFDDLLFTYSA